MSIKTLIPLIDETKFMSMKKHNRVLLLVDDVFALIRSGIVKPDNGTYLSMDDNRLRHLPGDTPMSNVRARKALENSGCAVCAKGAFLVSSLLRRNSCTVYDVQNACPKELAQNKLVPSVFSAIDFALIECAFEGWSCVSDIRKHFYVDKGYEPSYGEIGEVQSLSHAGYNWNARLLHEYNEHYYGSGKTFDDGIFPISTLRLAGVLFALKDNKGKWDPKFLPPLSKILLRLKLMKINP